MSNPSAKDSFRARAEAADGSYPESFVPQVEDLIAGTVVRYDSATTAFGLRDICVIADEDDNGRERSLWISDHVLIGEFAKLVPRPGERIVVKRLPDGVSAARGTKYKKYFISVDRPVSKSEVPDFARHLPPELRENLHPAHDSIEAVAIEPPSDPFTAPDVPGIDDDTAEPPPAEEINRIFDSARNIAQAG